MVVIGTHTSLYEPFAIHVPYLHQPTVPPQATRTPLPGAGLALPLRIVPLLALYLQWLDTLLCLLRRLAPLLSAALVFPLPWIVPLLALCQVRLLPLRFFVPPLAA